MTFRPLHDRVLVSRDAAPEETKVGLIIVPEAQQPPATGIVIAVGPGSPALDGSLVVPQTAAGEHVQFSAYAGQTITVDGEEYELLRDADILGVLS